jgi:predicted MPP superfamily phosphohydrolase
MGVLAALLVPAVGHVSHFILAVNITSAIGLRERPLARLRLCLLLMLIASSGLLLWMHIHDPWWTWSWPLRAYAYLCLFSGGVAVPFTSLRLGLRRRPDGITGRSELLDLTACENASALIGEGHGAWQLRIPGNESLMLRRREWQLWFPGLPPGLEGLSIVQLSDLHFSHCYHRRFFERVIEASQAWTADLLVVTGDVVDHDEVHDWIEPVLGTLTARIGKFAILGNHDSEHEPGRIIVALEHIGFELLEGRWTTIEEQGIRMALGGTSEPWGAGLDPGSMPEARFRLLLSHSPDRFYSACRWGIDLMLSGHNHGGQIRLPAIGPVLMPSLYSRRFDRGFFRHGSTLLYVSEGIGAEHPIRFGCPPEITRFVLTAQSLQ